MALLTVSRSLPMRTNSRRLSVGYHIIYNFIAVGIIFPFLICLLFFKYFFIVFIIFIILSFFIVCCRCDGSRRQLQAENNKKAPGQNIQRNPKYMAILKESQRFDESLEGMEDLCGTVFNSVFVHRFKDSQEIVR